MAGTSVLSLLWLAGGSTGSVTGRKELRMKSQGLGYRSVLAWHAQCPGFHPQFCQKKKNKKKKEKKKIKPQNRSKTLKCQTLKKQEACNTEV
jgi:hypothetical protein